MDYKESLLFIGKCLTLSHEEKNRLEIKNIISHKSFSWDAIVKVSTNHLVFPALFSNLRSVNFLGYLPSELVNYMEHIYKLNYNRNTQIIKQVKNINILLNENKVKAIFLKGAGNLIEGLYENLGNRMIGDIDLIVSKADYQKAISILMENGYSRQNNKIHFEFLNKHYPKIVKSNEICSVEVHSDMVEKPYRNHFNFNTIKKNLKQLDGNLFVLSFENQIIYTSLNIQINNKLQWFKTVDLRGSYDIYLLSKKKSTLNTLTKFKFYKLYLNNFIALSSFLFNSSKSLSYIKNSKSKKHLKKVEYNLIHRKKSEIVLKIWKKIFLIKLYFKIISKLPFEKNVRKTFFQRINKNLTSK